jgi:hypothetical protein
MMLQAQRDVLLSSKRWGVVSGSHVALIKFIIKIRHNLHFI